MRKEISLTIEVKKYLDMIRTTKGVENVVLTQRDGNPIQHSGIWLSKNELFSISAATSAIYNCGISLHHDKMKYILIEGKKAKILITPLRNYGSSTINNIIDAQNLQGFDDEFYVAITTKSNVNLGGIFLKIRTSLMNIKKCLILSGESFKPPKRKYSPEEIQTLLNAIDVKEDQGKKDRISLFSLCLPQNTYLDLDRVLEEFGRNTLDLISSYITFDGGFVLSSNFNHQIMDLNQIEVEATLSNSLFFTADKCAWLLKKMHIKSILLECIDEFQFINLVRNSIFSTTIEKGRQKLGLLRLIIPKYCTKIEKILMESESSTKITPEIKVDSLFSQLIL